MQIKDICKKELITSDINDSLKDISKKMQLHDIGFIPIKDKNDIVGVITDRDIVIRALTEDKTSLGEIMSINLISLDINEDINKALDNFRKYKIKRLLITESNNYVGVLSLKDCLNCGEDILDVFKSIYSETIEEDNVEVDTFEL